MMTDQKQKFQIQTEMTEMEMNFRKTNEIPDFLPQIWPSRKKSKEEVNDETSKKDLMINKKELKCLIAPIKTSKTIFHASNELPDCDVIDVKMLSTFSASTRSLSPDFILRNPKNAVLLLPKKNVTVVAPTASAKTQSKLSKSSSRGFSVSPRPITGGKHISFKRTWTPPITGGKTIRMTQHQPSRHEPYKRCKPQPRKTLPRCELVADSGIKMIIRLPKKV